MYADPRWVKGVTVGYMVGPDKMQDRKGHCPMMVTVDVKVGDPGDAEDDEQGSDEEGVSLPQRVRWPEEGKERGSRCTWKWGGGAMCIRPRVCGFNRQEGESQAQPNLQRLVASLTERHQEEVEARAQAEGVEWQAELAKANERVQAASRAVEDEHERVYQKVVAEH